MSQVANELKKVLANSFALYLKTQNYHWNVQGPHFKALHLLFEEQYTDLAAAIDEIAERIRALGEKAPGTWKAYQPMIKIDDGDENASAEKMVKEMANDQKIICETIKEALQAAQKDADEASTDLLVGRINVHEKAAWMLQSSI